MQQRVFDKSFITFLIVGVVNTLFGTAIMLVLYNVFDCSYWVSSFCDYFFGSILSYFLNKHFTFHYQGTDWRSITKFALNIIICYVLAYSIALPLTRYALESMHLSKVIVENVAMLVGTGLHPANSSYSELQDVAWGKGCPGINHSSSHAPVPGSRYTMS